jgi:hypothetical protein
MSVQFKKAINKETKESYKTLISATRFTARQFAVISDIIAHYDAATKSEDETNEAFEARKARYVKRHYTRTELYLAHVAVRNVSSNAYYLSKNKALVIANSSLRDLSRCKLAASSEVVETTALVVASDSSASNALQNVTATETKQLALTSRAKSRSTRKLLSNETL